MTNLSQAKGASGHFDFARVESIEVHGYTKGACSKLRQEVVMVMFSGKRHVWGEFIEDEKATMTKYHALLDAVAAAHKQENR